MGVPKFGMLDIFLSLFSGGTYTTGFPLKAVIFCNKTQLTFTKCLIFEYFSHPEGESNSAI